MFTIDKVAEFINNTMQKIPSPAKILPAELLYCTAIKRPGLSAYKIASQIITNNEALGIPTGQNTDGSPNKINEFVYNISKCIVDAIKNDAVIQAAIPAGSIQIQGEGCNEGGPVTVKGMNIISSIAKGLMR